MTSNLTIVSTEPVADVLELAEEVVNKARSGECIALAVVMVTHGGNVEIIFTESNSYHEMCSGAARLAHRIAGQGG